MNTRDYFGPPNSRIIFAADLPSEAGNSRVLEMIADKVDVIKVNIPLILRESPAVITRLRNRFGLPVFADVKIADVPHTCREIVKIMRDAAASAVMVHGIVGPDALAECMDAAAGALGLIVQLELTNPGGLIFTQPIANDMARAASLLDVYGYQSPGNRPERIRAIRDIVGPEPVIVCCGIGVQGGVYGDAIDAGGTYAIVGRAIYNSPNPLKAVQEIISSRVNVVV